MGAWFIVLFVLVAVAGIWWSWYSRKKRQEGLALASKQLGMQYAAEDPFGTMGLPFGLFSKGDGRGLENVMWGAFQGLDVREFDYWYYEESTDSEGHRHRSYYRFSCVVTEVPLASAGLTIGREGFFSRFADSLGFRDIEFELEEFNREFQVRSGDRKFANDFIDQRMMRWLLGCGDPWSFEVAGPYLMCFCKRLDPAELTPLLGTLKAFREQIPRVVYSLYGTGGQAAPQVPQMPPAPEMPSMPAPPVVPAPGEAPPAPPPPA